MNAQVKKSPTPIKKSIVKTNITKYSNFYIDEHKFDVSSIVYHYNETNTNVDENQYVTKKFSVQIEGKILFGANVFTNNNSTNRKLYINFDAIEEMKYYQEIFEGNEYSSVVLQVKPLNDPNITNRSIMNVQVKM